MLKIYIILTLLVLLLSLSCSDRIVFEDETRFNPDDLIPVFSPPGGTYHDEQNVTVSTKVEGATIRYTLDGSPPNDSSPVYSDSIFIAMPSTIRAKAYKPGWETKLSVAEYVLQTATPTFDPPGGLYHEPQRVTINCITEGATIRYTTDGNEPTSSSAIYSEPIDVPLGTTLKAKGFKDGWTASQTVSAQYIYIPEWLVLVEGGTFNPVANYIVTLSSFLMAKYEVTQSEWTSVMGGIYNLNWSDRGQGSNHPAYRISWFDAIEYCNRLSIREGLSPVYSYSTHGTNPDNWPSGWNTNNNNHTNVSCNWNANGYRLPTEMEWEFAARGGVPAQNAGTFNTTYSGSDNIDDVAWYSANSNSRTQSVGTKQPNELGLYDMSGNVWEWNWDIYGGYPSGSHNDPKGASSGDRRVVRGGSWICNASNCRVHIRNDSNASVRNRHYGFRVARTLN